MGLLDAQGSPIPGFTIEQCDLLHTNATAAEVSWQGRNDLTALVGHEVQAAFSGSRARLFGFYFRSLPSRLRRGG